MACHRGACFVTNPAITAVIWDVDGTLADTIPLCVEALATAISSHGGPDLSSAEIIGRFGPSEEGLLRNELGDRWVDAIETYLDEYERAHHDVALVFTEVRDLILALAEAGVPMAVVTGKGPRSAAITLDLIGLADAFEHVAAGSMDGPIKSTEIRRIIGAWGLEPARVAYVGDSPSDITEARAAGVIAVGAAWKPDADPSILERHGPDAILLSESDLVSWITTALDGDPR